MDTETSFWARFARYRRFVPAAAFVGGFLWDSLTLGRVVTSTDLWMLALYYLGAWTGVLLLLKDWSATWRSRLAAGVQFCFGGLFSALVVFYFKSSGSWSGLLVVSGLVSLLVVNEFLHSRYVRLEISWSLLCLVGIMYLNFLLPHWVHGIGVFWFLLSTLIGFALVLVLWKLSRRSVLYLLPPIGVTLAMVAGYFAGVIPPVPLVVKQHLLCKQLEKNGKDWLCMEPAPSLRVRLGISPPILYHAPGEKIHYLSSVFAPSRVQAELEHRWFHWDEREGWLALDSMAFQMVGGRTEGWRLNSYKMSLQPGRWRVETALRGGAVVGRSEFVIPDEPEPDGIAYQRRSLQ